MIARLKILARPGAVASLPSLKLILAVILAICPALMPALLLASAPPAASSCHAVSQHCCSESVPLPAKDQPSKDCPDCFSCWINCCGVALVPSQTFVFPEAAAARYSTISEKGSARTYPPPLPPPRAVV